MGISLGDYLAPRAAALEHRLAALIADDGLYSYQFREKARTVSRFAALFGHALGHPVLWKVMRRNTGIRWAIENGKFTFQVGSIWDLIEATDSWSLEAVANTITCPTLVCDAEGDHFFARQPTMLYEAPSCPKTLLRFTAEDGAEEHCQVGALLLSNHQVLSSLDTTLHINAQRAAGATTSLGNASSLAPSHAVLLRSLFCKEC
jgi:hypothetical protein